MNELKEKYDRFKHYQFPAIPVSDILSDIYSDFVEFDSYFAGTVSSYIAGNKINKDKLIAESAKMDNDIAQIENLYPELSSQLFVIKEYKLIINDIIELINCVSEIKKNPKSRSAKDNDI